MAKESKLVKNAERARLGKLHQKRRAELVAVIKDGKASPEAKDEAYARLYKMPRDASGTRFRNRCQLTGRPRGYMRGFGVSRIVFRELATQGLLPGVKKASW
ncbi:MAG: 30S ribosomal protein S14 [Dehalococcoidia bacterium]